VGGLGSGKSPADILAWMEKNHPAPAEGAKKRITYHLMSNIVIDCMSSARRGRGGRS
jgi:hypothetical protein